MIRKIQKILSITIILLLTIAAIVNAQSKSKKLISKTMTVEQIKQFIQGGWVSIAPEVRPSAIKNADGTLKPFYLTRNFKYTFNDAFELEVINYADAYGKVPLAKMNVKGHTIWQGA